MKEFTERHHAFISAIYYVLLTERFGGRGEAAFVHATQKYAEQRGARMAQRAIRDGQPLTFATYRSYGEWVNTKSTIEAGFRNNTAVTAYSPDCIEQITMCPWWVQYKEMGLVHAGTVYCAHLDNSIVRGFNPYLKFETIQSLHEHDCCIQISRGADFKEGALPRKHREYLKDFDYHCGHIYKTFSEIVCAIFKEEGNDVSQEVLSRFSAEYGADMAGMIAGYINTNFNVI